MLTIRKSQERGHANHGWLDTYHTFSFASYHDPKFMGFRPLRVINEDRVMAGEGFGTHPHRDMEIITYVLSGELSHKDSMGNGRTIKAGEVQGMSAGTGITHSEFNDSKKNEVHLLQIWIQPHTKSVTPSYSEWLPDGSEQNGWALVASEDGAKGSVKIHQNTKVYVAVIKSDTSLPIKLENGRYGWVQVAKGSAKIDGKNLSTGDGASFAAGDAESLEISAGSEILFFDLP